MGHADPGLALKVYAQAMRLDPEEQAKLRGLVDGEFGHRMDAKDGIRAGLAARWETAAA